MRIRVHLRALAPIGQPLSDADPLATLIYPSRDLASSGYATFLQRQGYGRGGRRFKLFTFSSLCGKVAAGLHHPGIGVADEHGIMGVSGRYELMRLSLGDKEVPCDQPWLSRCTSSSYLPRPRSILPALSSMSEDPALVIQQRDQATLMAISSSSGRYILLQKPTTQGKKAAFAPAANAK